MAADANPSISVRKYIKWGDAPPSEPTSTVVLTSPQRRFADVRLLLPVPPAPAAAAAALRDPARLDWAFAGTSEHDGAARPPHSVFRHWVDSRHVDAEAVVDEGDMVDADVPGEVVETGQMVNPASGRLESYEECWVDGLPADGGGGGGGVGGWVLRWEEGDGGRGLLVRIGQRVQGVLRSGEQVGVGRWTVGAGQGGPPAAVAEIGPCDGFPVDGWEGVRLGETITAAQGSRWVCVESW